MGKLNIKFLLLLLCSLVLGCTSTLNPTATLPEPNNDQTETINVNTDGSNNLDSNSGSIGTTISKPKPPTLNLFPDFGSKIPAAELAAIINQMPKDEIQVQLSDIYEKALCQTCFDDLKRFGVAFAHVLGDMGVTQLSDHAQTASLDEAPEIFYQGNKWEVEASSEPNHPEYQRYYFLNKVTQTLQATYLMMTDNDGIPVRGIFVFVAPRTIAEEPIGKLRTWAMAYDFTNPEQNLMITREDKIPHALETYYVNHNIWQCAQSKEQCVSEYAEIRSPEPSRILGKKSHVRLYWDMTSDDICMESMGTPTTDSHPCDGLQAVWAAHMLTSEDLLMRFKDTIPTGGDAANWYRDGQSKEGWNLITVDLIDGWLDASKLNQR